MNVQKPVEMHFESKMGDLSELFRYKAESLGEFEFRGEILFDTTRIPFFYKFLVK